jgi:hypothetical protein
MSQPSTIILSTAKFFLRFSVSLTCSPITNKQIEHLAMTRVSENQSDVRLQDDATTSVVQFLQMYKFVTVNVRNFQNRMWLSIYTTLQGENSRFIKIIVNSNDSQNKLMFIHVVITQLRFLLRSAVKAWKPT